MGQPRQPRRPTSPWSIGAAILGAFIALAIFLGDSTFAVQVMVAGALLVGLLLMWKTRTQDPEATGQAVREAPLARSRTTAPPQHADDLPAVLTVDEAAIYLRSDVASVSAELEAGRMPGNILGGDWRLRRAALDAWLDGAYGSAASNSSSG